MSMTVYQHSIQNCSSGKFTRTANDAGVSLDTLQEEPFVLITLRVPFWAHVAGWCFMQQMYCTQ